MRRKVAPLGTPPPAGWPRPRPVRPAGWWFDGLLLAALVGLTLALAGGYFLGVDVAVRDWVDAHRPPPAFWTARGLNFLGQGGWLLTPLATLLAVAVGVRSRSIRPLLVVVAAFGVTYLTIGPMKLLLRRGYPHDADLDHPERLFSDPDTGLAYPSGHVANAIVWYGVIALLIAALLRTVGRGHPAVDVGGAARPIAVPFPGHRALRVLPAVIVFCTTTYLGHHWLTDSIAGLLLGWLLVRLLDRTPWDDLPLPDLPGALPRPAARR